MPSTTSCRSRVSRRLVAVLVVALATMIGSLTVPADPAVAHTSERDRVRADPGPALRVPPAQLRRALTCTRDLARSRKAPVLLAPDYSSSADSYGWNFGRALPKLGFPTCRLDLPRRGTADLQVEAEYVVHAVRTMHARSGKRVTVLGHAFIQLAVRWAARFWPDLAGRIRDSISIAAPEQGTDLTSGCELLGSCPPSAWQARTGSVFLERLNRGRFRSGPAYTTISTRLDELIFPQPRAGTLVGARNISLQAVCPGRVVDHFSILGDAVTYRLVLDAMAHRGPAKPRRLPSRACGEVFMPGVLSDPTLPQRALSGLLQFPLILLGHRVPAEPKLRGYAR